MALTEYRKKRKFDKTPEPGPKEKRTRTGRMFVIQKHRATQLHYDFRLEVDGVLKSWAVPKGPSLDPSVKRLAMQVEDHAVDYAKFEGVIPEGEYGGGTVMVWDYGTYKPENATDVSQALKKGELKFSLNGKKLKGSWVLVRTGGRYPGGGDRSWLLIKHKDDWAGELDITEFAPLSVKSEGDFADILADGNPEIWISNRPAQGGETGAMFQKIVERALEMRGHEVTKAPAAKGTKKSTPTAKRAGASRARTKTTKIMKSTRRRTK